MWILVNYTGKNMTSYMINVKLVKKKAHRSALSCSTRFSG